MDKMSISGDSGEKELPSWASNLGLVTGSPVHQAPNHYLGHVHIFYLFCLLRNQSSSQVIDPKRVLCSDTCKGEAMYVVEIKKRDCVVPFVTWLCFCFCFIGVWLLYVNFWAVSNALGVRIQILQNERYVGMACTGHLIRNWRCRCIKYMYLLNMSEAVEEPIIQPISKVFSK